MPAALTLLSPGGVRRGALPCCPAVDVTERGVLCPAARGLPLPLGEAWAGQRAGPRSEGD
jgi:hypothetical protein